jgi:2-dehydro-3-deoxyglucarate aldolase/4-hydroxy-2-oxoheptanedioate aldolase
MTADDSHPRNGPPPEPAREALDAGERVRGAWNASMSERVAEVLAADLEWVGLDMEHSPLSARGVERLVRAVRPAATPIVRLPSVAAAAAGTAKRALDAGAGGVIVPGVETAAAAERAVAAARFPPAGERGVAGTVRANDYGAAFDAYLADANERTIVVLQLESPTAIENAPDILDVEGVDVAFVGENDLSAALGYPGETDREPVREAVERVRSLAVDRGVVPGIAGRTPEALAERAERGFRFFLLGSDLGFVRDGLAPFE